MDAIRAGIYNSYLSRTPITLFCYEKGLISLAIGGVALGADELLAGNFGNGRKSACITWNYPATQDAYLARHHQDD